MASMRNRIQARVEPVQDGRRKWLIVAIVIIGALVLAWFDGGEEPIHPISRNIPLPEVR